MAAQPTRPSDPGTEMPLRRLYQVVFRHQKKMLLFFCLVFGGVLVAAVLAPRSYRSEAKLLVQIGRESVTLDPTATIGERTLDPRTTWENELNSELEIVRSNELVREVVQGLGPDAIFRRGRGAPATEPGWLARTLASARAMVTGWLPAEGARLSDEDRAVLLVASKLEIRLVLDSSVIKISFEAPEPELARQVVASLIERYLEKHRAIHASHGSFAFFSGETTRLHGELEAREEELRGLKNAAGVSSVEEERQILLQRIAALEKEVDLTASAVDSGAAKVAALTAALTQDEFQERVVMQETTAPTSPVKDQLRQQLHTLRLEEQNLLQSYEVDTPPVRSVRERIALATEMLTAEEAAGTLTTRGLNPSRQSVRVALLTEEALLASLRAKRAILGVQLAELRGQQRGLNDLELALKRKAREIATLEEQYRRHSSSLEQVRVDQALQLEKISNITVLQTATVPLVSTTLSRTTAALAGLFLGLAGALALAFVMDFLDQSVRSPEDVRARLGLPLLASIPRSRALRGWRRIAVTPLHEFSQLKDRLVGGPAAGVIAVTSARRGEGVSTVSANLAHALAARGEGAVLLVDAALFRPSVQRTFATPLSPGLAEQLLANAASAVRESAAPNLRILTAGDALVALPKEGRRARAAAVFDRLAREFDELLAVWKRDHRYVIVDLPALDEQSQVPLLASRCEGTLLVVAAEQSRWQSVRHAQELLAAYDVKLLGVVLNKRRYPIPGLLYRTL